MQLINNGNPYEYEGKKEEIFRNLIILKKHENERKIIIKKILNVYNNFYGCLDFSKI